MIAPVSDHLTLVIKVIDDLKNLVHGKNLQSSCLKCEYF